MTGPLGGAQRVAVVHGRGEALGEMLLDRVRRAAPEIVWESAAGPDPSGTDLAGADAVVYMAGSRGTGDLPDPGDAGAWLRCCASRAVPHVVLMSSARVFAPGPRHLGLVTEGQRTARPGGHPVADRWLRVEKAARGELEASGSIRLTVLRPAATPVPGGRDLLSRMLTARVAVTLPGHDPTLQLLAVEDLAAAVALAVRCRPSGTFHLAPADAVSLRRALELSDTRRLPIPRFLQAPARAALAPGGRAYPLSRLDYIRYDWTVSGPLAREELGFEPDHGSTATVRQLADPVRPAAVGEDRSEPAPSASSPDPTVRGDDPFGMDEAFIAARARFPLHFLHDVYWRVELDGLEHVPRQGPAVIVGTHRGFFPWDGIMVFHALASRLGRYPRFMIHPGLLKFPFFFDLFRKLGGIPACRENADWVLSRDGVLAIFPEGIRGAFRLYRDAHRLDSFGRPEFVRAARRHGAPIVPFVTVGSAAASPIFARIESRRWRRYAMWPFIPVTHTLLPLPLPLPTKWHTRFLPPVDPGAPHARGGSAPWISDDIRARMQAEVDDIVARRPSVLYGNVFD